MHLRAGAWLQRFDLDISRMVCDLALWEHSASVLVIEGGRGGRGCVGERSGEEVRAITDLKPFSGIFVGTEDIFRGPQGRVTVCVMPGWLLGVILTEMMMVTSLHDEDAGRWGPRLWLSWCRPSSSAPQMSELASDGRCWSRAPRAGASAGQSQTTILASGAACTKKGLKGKKRLNEEKNWGNKELLCKSLDSPHRSISPFPETGGVKVWWFNILHSLISHPSVAALRNQWQARADNDYHLKLTIFKHM